MGKFLSMCALLSNLLGFSGGSGSKNPTAMRETWIRSQVYEDPLVKGTAIYSIFWPGEFHGQRSLAGYSRWGRKESDTTEQFSLWIIASSI